MDDHLVIFTTPGETGERKIYPVVRLSGLNIQNSGWFSSEPVALLIEENGKWYFSVLEEGFSEDNLLRAEPI